MMILCLSDNQNGKSYHYQRLALRHDAEFTTVTYSQNFILHKQAKPTRDMASSSSPGVTTMPSKPLSSCSETPVDAESAGYSKDVASPRDGRPRTPPHQIYYSVSENHNLLERLRDEKQRAKSSL